MCNVKPPHKGDAVFNRIDAYKNHMFEEPERAEFACQQYLAENKGLIQFFAKAILDGSNKILLDAPCGVGKTTFFCSLIAPLFKADYQVIILTPNRIQSEQNASIHLKDPVTLTTNQVYCVTAKSGVHLSPEENKTYSCVYDKADEILNYDEMSAYKTILVIDEAHELEDARDYRATAISKIGKAAEYINDCGGTVVYMTGTPQKLMGHNFNYWIHVDRVDEAQNILPRLNMETVDIYRKDSHKVNMLDFLVNVVCEMRKNNERPIVHLNDIKKIREAANKLHSLGVHSQILTSYEKGFTEYKDKSGKKMRKYHSQMYQSIVERSALPEADCYLVTSILDVGTSITGVIGQDGKVHEDASLAPVFLTRDPKDFDVDKITQFFSRIRYTVHRGVILMNMPENRYEVKQKPTLEHELARICQEAAGDAQALSRAPRVRRLLSSMQGQPDTLCLHEVPCGRISIYDVDYSAMVALAVQKLYKAYYFACDDTAEFLSERFGIPVTSSVHASGKSIKMPHDAGYSYSDELKAWTREAVQHDDFVKALTSQMGIDGRNRFVRQIRTDKDGEEVLFNLRTLFASYSYTRKDIANIAIALASERKPHVTLESGEYVKDPLGRAKNEAYKAMADWSIDELAAFRDYSAYSMEGNGFNDDDDEDEDEEHVVRIPEFHAAINLGTKKMRVVMAYAAGPSNLTGWKKICHYAETHSVEALRVYINSIVFAELNLLNPTSALYEFYTGYRTTNSGAQYHILRCGIGLNYPDQKTGKACNHFKGGFAGNIVTPYDLEQIAMLMNILVHKVKTGFTQNSVYTARMVERMLEAIYETDEKKADGSFYVKGLRKAVFSKTVTEKVNHISNAVDYTMRSKSLSPQDKMNKIEDLTDYVPCDEEIRDYMLDQFQLTVNRMRISPDSYRPGMARDLIIYSLSHEPDWDRVEI